MQSCLRVSLFAEGYIGLAEVNSTNLLSFGVVRNVVAVSTPPGADFENCLPGKVNALQHPAHKTQVIPIDPVLWTDPCIRALVRLRHTVVQENEAGAGQVFRQLVVKGNHGFSPIRSRYASTSGSWRSGAQVGRTFNTSV